MRLFVRDDNALTSAQTVVHVSGQLVFAADEMARRRVVLVEVAARGVVRAPADHVAGVLRPGVDCQCADHADVARGPGGRVLVTVGWRWWRVGRRAEAYRASAAHAHVQLAQSLRVLQCNRQTAQTS